MTNETEIGEWTGEWYPYEGGVTLGQIGPAGGYVLRDEEWGDPDDDEDADARVTLEQGRADNPGYFATATLYGWLHHTQTLPGGMNTDRRAAADSAYDKMKEAAMGLVALLPYEEDDDVEAKVAVLNGAIADFERRFA